MRKTAYFVVYDFPIKLLSDCKIGRYLGHDNNITPERPGWAQLWWAGTVWWRDAARVVMRRTVFTLGVITHRATRLEKNQGRKSTEQWLSFLYTMEVH